MTDVPAVASLGAADPRAAGFDPERLAEAVAFARANESVMDRDIGRALEGGHFAEPLPDGEIIGPTRPRGDPSGMILRGGRVAAAWGPVDAPDMTFSVTKSYLAICAGLAWDDGLIRLDEPARNAVPDLFEAPQNRAITWRHLLQQTSEWEGELWGKADRIDRNRSLDTPPGTPSLKGTHRDLRAPGEFWEYNDVRVNVLAYALMRVFGRPLPEVLAERIMRPVGASDAWEWHGYRNSWVEIGGRRVQSVSGGAHWGGGMFIPTTDHARVALMMLNRGRWGDRQLLSREWVDECLTPSALNPSYGFLWWLNGDLRYCPTAPRSSFFALGVAERDLDRSGTGPRRRGALDRGRRLRRLRPAGHGRAAGRLRSRRSGVAIPRPCGNSASATDYPRRAGSSSSFGRAAASGSSGASPTVSTSR